MKWDFAIKFVFFVMCLMLVVSMISIAFAEEVVIKVRTKAGPPFEDWRGNNFIDAVNALNAALEVFEEDAP